MKVRRQYDGKVYQVVREANGRILIHHPQHLGEMWVDGRYSDVVDDDTPVDVP